MNQRIGFEHSTILTINGRIQHTDDTVPKALAAFVEYNHHRIEGQMELLVKQDIQRAPLALPDRPTILIAKFALLRDIGDVLTLDAIQSSEFVFREHYHVKEPYVDYFVELSKGTFTPEVQRKGGDETEQGVWLGVTYPH